METKKYVSRITWFPKRLLLSLGLVSFFTLLSTSSMAQCACCAGAGMGASGDPSMIFSTPMKRQFIVDAALDYRSVQEGLMSHAMVMSETTLQSMFISSLALRYGISDRFAVSVQQPYLFIKTALGNDRGLGDMQLNGQWRLFSQARLNVVLNGGIELPVGIQKAASFEQSTSVIGSGSFDPVLGISFGWKHDRLAFSGAGVFKKTTNGFQHNNYGSSSLQSLGISYQAFGEPSSCNTDSLKEKEKAKPSVVLHIAYLGEWLDKLVEDDTKDDDSGYYVGYIAGGVSTSFGKWSLPMNVGYPVLCNMNGMQNNPGIRFRIGLTRAF